MRPFFPEPFSGLKFEQLTRKKKGPFRPFRFLKGLPQPIKTSQPPGFMIGGRKPKRARKRRFATRSHACPIGRQRARWMLHGGMFLLLDPIAEREPDKAGSLDRRANIGGRRR